MAINIMTLSIKTFNITTFSTQYNYIQCYVNITFRIIHSALSTMTFGIMTLRIMTFSLITLRIITFSTITLFITAFIVTTLSKQHSA